MGKLPGADDNDELYKKYRPNKLADLVGQANSVDTLTQLGRSGKFPHALLLSGPSGTGKTTIARILKGLLDVGDADYVEQNSASFRGIDSIRDIEATASMAAISGKNRMWLIDEAHQLTPAAQEAFLKLLEDPPKHVYIVLATTEPKKLKAAVLTRCTEIKLQALNASLMLGLLQHVVGQEGKACAAKVLNRIVEAADGSPRKALVLLHQVLQLPTEEQQLNAVVACEEDAPVFQICLALNRGANWSQLGILIANVLEAEGSDPEGLRYMVLGYFKKVLLGAAPGPKADKAAHIIGCFERAFYDGKTASFARAAYLACTGK